jgi:hypothetical protein
MQQPDAIGPEDPARPRIGANAQPSDRLPSG